MMNKYFELMKKYPAWFENVEDSDAIEIITDKKNIAEIQLQTNTKVGIVYEDSYICVLKDAVVFPNKKNGTYIRIQNPKNQAGSIIIPQFGDKFLFLNHYRHALRRFCLEFPRGFGEEGLLPIENALKELYEECGLRAEKAKIIGKTAPDSGLLGTEQYVIHAVVACDHVAVQDAKEGIKETVWLSMEEIKEKVCSGDITDGYSLAAAFMLLAQQEKKENG